MVLLLALVVALQDQARAPLQIKEIDFSKMDALVTHNKEELKKLDATQEKMMADDESSLLQTGAKPVQWTAADSERTEGLLKASYTNIDKVQDDIIKAANEELEEQKSLPTLAQATHHWDSSKFDDGSGASSLLQTGEPLEQEYENAIDFSKLDKLRHKVDGANTEMQHDFADLTVQTQRDEAFAKQQEQALPKKAASLSERAHAFELPAAHYAHPSHVNVKELAHLIEEREAHRKKDEARIQHAAGRLHAVQGKLGLLEKQMAAKAMKAGASMETRSVFQRLRSLLALSKKAGGLVNGVGAPHTNPKEQLEALEEIKRHLGTIKLQAHKHTEEHIRDMEEHLATGQNVLQRLHAAPRMSLVQKDAPADVQPVVDETGYAPIEQGLEGLQQRIKGQVAALKQEEKKETDAQVNTLNAENPAEQYKFAWAQPSAYAEVDSKGNMRTQ